MADTGNRIARLRELMEKRGYDAVVLRNNPDLRWLTGAERVFDDEVAHTAFITADALWLHTDSRYYGMFAAKLGEDTPWRLDMEIVDAPAWVARRVDETRSHVVAIEDTADLAFYDGLREELRRASVAALLPRLHGDIALRLRAVKDAEELALLRRAQEITDDAFEHIVGYIKAGMTELDVRVELDNYMLSHGVEGRELALPHVTAGQAPRLG